jgi:hypothetical protein
MVELTDRTILCLDWQFRLFLIDRATKQKTALFEARLRRKECVLLIKFAK